MVDRAVREIGAPTAARALGLAVGYLVTQAAVLGGITELFGDEAFLPFFAGEAVLNFAWGWSLGRWAGLWLILAPVLIAPAFDADNVHGPTGGTRLDNSFWVLLFVGTFGLPAMAWGIERRRARADRRTPAGKRRLRC